MLSGDELRRAASFHFEKDRRLYLLSHLLVRRLLSTLHPLEPAEWRFETNCHGKPHVAPALPPIHFNLSHTAGLVACAASARYTLGIDVENSTKRADPRLVRDCFSTDEAAHLEALTGDEFQAAFYDLWTLKEAYLKARGVGLSLPLTTFSILPSSPCGAMRVQTGRRGGYERWRFARFRPSKEHHLAVCLEGDPADPPRVDLRAVPVTTIIGE